MVVTAAPNTSLEWISEALDRLATLPCGYHAGEPTAAEPAALAALALVGAGRTDDARPHLEWLAGAQNASGSIAPFAEVTQSAWQTALAVFAAVLAAHTKAAIAGQADVAKRSAKERALQNSIELNARRRFNISQATEWLLRAMGNTMKNSPEIGHNGRLVGWPWVIGTHSWQEPTAWSVLALKSLGMRDHLRTREGVRLLIDRLLSTGGCNFGNTIVLGQQLRPQIAPTGITMVALAGEQNDDPRIERSLEYLAESTSATTAPMSLSYSVLGLTAHKRRPAATNQWLEGAYRQTVNRDVAPLILALLVLAAQGAACPLIKNSA